MSWLAGSSLAGGAVQWWLISTVPQVQLLDPLLAAEYANRQSGQVESLVNDCGFDSHLGYCEGPVVQRRRLLAHIQATMVRVHPGSLIGP